MEYLFPRARAALIHAVQVINFVKTPIWKTLRERDESVAEDRLLRSCSDSPTSITDILSATIDSEVSREQALNTSKEPTIAKFSKDATMSRLECGLEENYGAFSTVMEKRN